MNKTFTIIYYVANIGVLSWLRYEAAFDVLSAILMATTDDELRAGFQFYQLHKSIAHL